MQDLSRMHILQTEAKLNEPVHNLSLSELFLSLLFLLDVVSQVAIFAELHDDHEDSFLKEGVLVGHDVRMIKLPQQFGLRSSQIVVFTYLEVSSLLLFVGQLAEDDLFRYEVVLLPFRRVPELYQKRSTEIASTYASHLFEFLIVLRVNVQSIRIS